MEVSLLLRLMRELSWTSNSVRWTSGRHALAQSSCGGWMWMMVADSSASSFPDKGWEWVCGVEFLQENKSEIQSPARTPTTLVVENPFPLFNRTQLPHGLLQ